MARKIPENLRIDSARAVALIVATAREPGGRPASEFDAAFYQIVKWYSLKRASSLSRVSIRPAGKGGEIFIPGASTADREFIAHDTATRALERARKRAGSFRPGMDDPIDWVLRNAPIAYIDAVRSAHGRGAVRLIPTEHSRLEALADARMTYPPPDTIADVRDVLSRLTEPERKALVLFERDGHTYDEIGQIIYGQERAGKKVDHLLQNARYKLRSLWQTQGPKPS